MLFTPWKNEETDLKGKYSSYIEHYDALSNRIAAQMQQYAVCADDLNEMQRLDLDDDGFDSIAPVTQHVELQDMKMKVTKIYILILMKDTIYQMTLGIPSRQPNGEPLILNEMQDDDYRSIVQKLKKQKEFFAHALHLIKTSNKPFYCFLSGGGGVGKSHLTKSIYQAVLKYYNSRQGEDYHQVNISLLAPTGKAAFLIKGNTIHSAFAVPASQSLKNL